MKMRLHYQEYRKKPYVARWTEGGKTRNRFFDSESERAKFIHAVFSVKDGSEGKRHGVVGGIRHELK